MIDKAITSYWSSEITEDAKVKPSLKYLNISNLSIGQPHYVWTTLTSHPRDVTHAGVKARLLTNTYTLQSNRAKFNQHDVSSICILCEKEPEDRCHFLLRCSKLSPARDYHVNHLKAFLDSTFPPEKVQIIMGNNQLATQLILDCSHQDVVRIMGRTSFLPEVVEPISRKLCFALHVQRSALLEELSNQPGHL
jgi:hypothetical protein